MMTDADLKKIEKMLDGIESRLDSRIGNLDSRIGNLDSRLGESILKLQKKIMLLKVEMKREFKRVHSDQNLIINHFNKEFLSLQARVEKLEPGISSQAFS